MDATFRKTNWLQSSKCPCACPRETYVNVFSFSSLSMLHEERILRSAYRPGTAATANLSHSASPARMRNTVYGSNEPAKAYDLYGTQSKRMYSNLETEHDSIEKKARTQKRWHDVLEKKNLNVEIKKREVSDMLMKRFKKEKDS